MVLTEEECHGVIDGTLEALAATDLPLHPLHISLRDQRNNFTLDELQPLAFVLSMMEQRCLLNPENMRAIFDKYQKNKEEGSNWFQSLSQIIAVLGLVVCVPHNAAMDVEPQPAAGGQMHFFRGHDANADAEPELHHQLTQANFDLLFNLNPNQYEAIQNALPAAADAYKHFEEKGEFIKVDSFESIVMATAIDAHQSMRPNQ